MITIPSDSKTIQEFNSVIWDALQLRDDEEFDRKVRKALDKLPPITLPSGG